MQFDWPTPEQMIYRVTRLRRLVVLAVAIPVCVMLFGALIDPTFLSVDRATLGATAVAVLIVAHVMLFPNAPLETLSLSFATTLLVISAPWIKILASLAPTGNANAVLAILVVLAILAAGLIVVAVQVALWVFVYAGPVIRKRVRAVLDVPCAPSVAHRQFALQPAMRRGRILCGPLDSDGLFDVAIVAPQLMDPENVDQPFVARITAKVLHSDENNHQVMLILADGSIAASSHTFAATDDGCRVTATEMPGDFTLGMHLMFWLTDQHADNMTEVADTIMSETERANGLAHGVSFVAVASAVLSPREPVAKRAK